MRPFLMAVAPTCVLFFGTPCPAQSANFRALDTQSDLARSGASCAFQERDDGIEDYPNCVLQDGQGKLFVPQDYVKKMRFNSLGLAAVFDYDPSRQEFLYVDQKGRVIVQNVPGADNWAAEFSDGLVPIVVHKKYGYADRNGKIVIAPKYDGYSPFEHGYAVVCIGCREVCAMSDPPSAADADCEHHISTGGNWFKINKAGHVVATVPHQ